MGWVVSDLGYGFAHVGVAVGLVGGEDVLEAGGAGVCEFDHVLSLCAGNFFGGRNVLGGVFFGTQPDGRAGCFLEGVDGGFLVSFLRWRRLLFLDCFFGGGEDQKRVVFGGVWQGCFTPKTACG